MVYTDNRMDLKFIAQITPSWHLNAKSPHELLKML